MKTTKKLGIWMDHSIAHLMEFTFKHFEIETIESKFTNNVKNTDKMTENQKHAFVRDYFSKA